MNRRLLIFAGLAVAVAAAIALPKLTNRERGKEVEVTAAERQVIKSSILASGTLAYREQVQLRSEVIGQVAELAVAESDRVESGQLILRLDPEQLQAAVEQQEANVRIQEIAIERQQVAIAGLERQVKRNERLFRDKLVDEDSYDLLTNQLELARVDLRSRREQLSQARAALAQSRELLSKTEIRSPIDGIVIKLDVKAGETVISGTTNIPGSTLMVIADTSEMLAEVQVDEADIAQVRVDQSCDVFAAAFPDTPLQGRVESIAPTAAQAPGQQARSFLVKVLLKDPEGVGVRSGMSARAEIFTESSDQALAVPVQAIVYDEEAEGREGQVEQPYVFVVDNDVAVRRDVALGLSSDSMQEITDGLDDDERVVSGPFRELRDLRDGDRVKIVEGGDDEADET